MLSQYSSMDTWQMFFDLSRSRIGAICVQHDLASLRKAPAQNRGRVTKTKLDKDIIALVVQFQAVAQCRHPNLTSITVTPQSATRVAANSRRLTAFLGEPPRSRR